MRPEHRHELKTNELARWLSNLPQWAKENLKMIIYVSVVVIVVAAAYFWKIYQKNVVLAGEQLEFTRLVTSIPRSKVQILQAQSQGVDYSFVLINTANSLQNIARNTKNDLMAALALIKRAEALRTELHYRLGTVSQKDIADQIKRAQNSYNEALSRLTSAEEKGKASPSLTAIADFGLGLCEEELGNFDKAGQIYRDITINPQFEPTTAYSQAKIRLETMADYQSKVVFAPAPEPTTEQVKQPQVPLGPADMNIVPQTLNIPLDSATSPELPNEVTTTLPGP